MRRNMASKNKRPEVGKILWPITVTALLFFFVSCIFNFGYPTKHFLLKIVENKAVQRLGEYPVTAVVTEKTEQSYWTTITVSAVKYNCLPKARLFINGTFVTNFNNNPVTLRVQHRDLITIDTSFYNTAIAFKINSVSGDILEPKIEQVYNSFGSTIEFVVKTRHDGG